MAKGVIYVMTSVVNGLIKIGKTSTANFESRMYQLERNGYFNVGGLKRRFAIEVDDYDEKEQLLDEIFAKSNVPNSELFAIDPDLVVQLLSSFEGKQIYPQLLTKAEVFMDAAVEYQENNSIGLLPNGIYYLNRHVNGFGDIEAKLRVKDGVLTLLKDCLCAPSDKQNAKDARRNVNIINNVLREDFQVNSSSTAGLIVLGYSVNGWITWKNEGGEFIDIYRRNHS